MPRELARLDIDIAGLSEVRSVEQGSLMADRTGYTLFWSGKHMNERRLSSVGFKIKTSIARKLQNLPAGHSDHLMSPRLQIHYKKFATVLSVYSPTLQAEIGVKKAFYRNLHNLLQQVDSKDRLLILRGCNSKSGTRLRTVERRPRQTGKWQLQ